MASHELSPYQSPQGSHKVQSSGTGHAIPAPVSGHSPSAGAPTGIIGAGWYPDSQPHQERWWDGQAWTEAVRPAVPAQQVNTVVVQQQVAPQRPMRLVKLTRSQHTVHTLLTVFTVGMWLPVYALHFLLASHKEEPIR